MKHEFQGRFYLIGLGILMRDITFTPEEELTLSWLCSAAAESDAVFWDRTRSIIPGSTEWYNLERLKTTLRSLGKAEELKAHYDRAGVIYS